MFNKMKKRGSRRKRGDADWSLQSPLADSCRSPVTPRCAAIPPPCAPCRLHVWLHWCTACPSSVPHSMLCSPNKHYTQTPVLLVVCRGGSLVLSSPLRRRWLSTSWSFSLSPSKSLGQWPQLPVFNFQQVLKAFFSTSFSGKVLLLNFFSSPLFILHPYQQYKSSPLSWEVL